MEDFTYDTELASEEFWAFVKERFDEWNDEDRVDRRVVISNNQYKVTFIAEGPSPDEMIIRVTKR